MVSDCSSGHPATLLPSAIENLSDSIVRDCDPGRVGPARAVYAAAGMRARRCEIEAADRCLRTAEPRDRTEDQLLIELRRSRADRATREIGVARLEIGGSHHV